MATPDETPHTSATSSTALPRVFGQAEVKQHLAWLGAKSPVRTLDCSALEQVDDAGCVFLWILQARRGWMLANLSEKCRETIQQAAELRQERSAAATQKAAEAPGLIARLGNATRATALRTGEAIAYLGELLWTWLTLLFGRFRWNDCRIAFLHCGVGAVPVMMLIGFLLGLILAFQSAIPLKMFGAEGFVGGLVGLAVVRELGLIIAAILMAGRTGSAFAAELGTMKVNEEIDALETMGLRPVRFLVLPRVLAGTLALPILTLFAAAAGLLGGWLVMSILDFSSHYYLNQLQAFVQFKDIIGSLAKAVIFGFMISAVGCWYGLKAGQDAGAVGRATTAAVVTGIILLTILEGVFAVIFYAMGW